MRDAISVRHAVERDLDQVLAIEYQAPTAAHWARAVYAAIVSDTNAQLQRSLFVAERAGKVVGFAVAQAVFAASYPPECELENIAVSHEARRGGVGHALLQSACDWARALRGIELHAEVRESNVAARAFYASAGFAQTAIRPSYYHDPVEDARLLTLHL